jgi:hypothetical protein
MKSSFYKIGVGRKLPGFVENTNSGCHLFLSAWKSKAPKG